jgi:C-terminal processing protease CtpA/Prc
MSLRQLSLLPFLFVIGCSAETSAPADANPNPSPAPVAPSAPEEQQPKPEPTAEQLAQVKELEEMLAYLEENTAWHSPIDWDKLAADGKKTILSGDGSSTAFFGALYDAFVSVPQGHQGLYLTSGCGTKVPMIAYAQRGACGRPHANGIVVTHARTGNPLGLAAGDVVTRVGDVSGRAMIDALGKRPMCVTSRPDKSFADTSTAATFADLLRAGEKIEVTSADGKTRTITVPDGGLGTSLKSALACSDPLGRSTSIPVESWLRPDGIGVIRLPGFTDPQQAFPTNPSEEEYEAYKTKFEEKIKVAFDKVKDARAIIWDVRGNGGGLTMVGLGIAAGFPGAAAGEISYCQGRVQGSSPPKFDSFKYAEYALTPGGQFAYSGKVAVLIDGMNYSAADYFPLAIKTKTNAILVGTRTAGGFGATSDSKIFDGPPAFSVAVDVNRCSLASDDTPLEGHGVEPHVTVEYDEKDLAAGKDTVLDRAVAEIDK